MTPTSHDVRPRSRSASPLVHPGKSTSGQQNVARSDSHSPPSRHQDIHPTQKDHDPRHHHRQHHRSHHHHRERTKTGHPPQGAPIVLPYNNGPLSKQALPQCRSLFALYLDVQKQRLIEDVPEDEVRGRWKSFVGKWYGFPLLPEQRHVRLTPRADILQLVLTKTCHARNRGELSDGWYDPSTWQRAEAGAVEAEETHTGEGTGDEKAAEPGKKRKRSSPTDSPSRPVDTKSGPDADGRAKRANSSDCEIGPSLPLASRGAKDRSGPSIPRAGDLQLQRETRAEDARLEREDLRYARKQERVAQKALVDELVPRAEAGSRERLLEKKADVRAYHNERAVAGSGVEEVPDRDLLGGGEDEGLEGLKRKKGEWERKKNERELRKEEMLRARREEREEMLRAGREKEERVMRGLKAIAKERFG